MHFTLKLPAVLAIMTALTTSSALADGWVKSYALEMQQHAFYFPGDGTAEAPGPDCPNGALPAIDRRKALKTSYRTWEEVDKLLDPENPQWARIGGIRGPSKENVYEKPWSVPDPGMTPVEGDVAYGFDLDGDPSTGFTGTDGTPGVDHTYYYMAGCMLAYRGRLKNEAGESFATEYMLNGAFAVLMLVSGEGDDPANDDSVKIAFYLSDDDLVKDANGDVTPDYSYRINTDPRFQSVMSGRTENGMVIVDEPSLIKLHAQVNAGFFPPQLKLFRGQLRLEPNEDCGLHGFIGGYREIKPYYDGWARAGTIHEAVSRIDIPAYWYALHRNADFKANPDAEQNDAISVTYYMRLVPAFAVEPDGRTAITQAKLYEGEIEERLSAQIRPIRGTSGSQ
ncbi:MAG: hypothetical protein CMK09_01695 [Ponticaulis sp.]|nr:hypothetical protein [Ponticaulis sp.]|tara:strand:- start:18969 stop:20153 length:1185 start_codon:yes stop_codon:yes gene_type:complete